MNIQEKDGAGQSPTALTGLSTQMPRGAAQPTVKQAALAYVTEGISVVPCHDKRATVDWIPYQQRRADIMEIHKWDTSFRLKQIAIVCGAVSGNLVVIDLDGEQAVALYERTFPGLLDTFTVRTGSGRGKHIYYYADSLPENVRVMNFQGVNLELRSNGAYVIAPPSVGHETGLPYQVIRETGIARLPNLDNVRTWMLVLNDAKKLKPRTHSAIKPIQPKSTGWADRALGYEARDVRLAPEGTRNDRLNVAAYNIGQLVGDGLLARPTVESALLAAALGAGLDERESLNTIQSGLNRGIAEPRSAQWRKRGIKR